MKLLHRRAPATPRASWPILAVLAALALWRALAFVWHEPLLALGNNYDQIRFTACLGVAPWRPGVPPDRFSPEGPQTRFSFQPLPADVCAWTSDLAFTAPVVLAWRVAEAFGGRDIHSVRRLAEWRLLWWVLLAALATRLLLQAGRPDLAAVHLALLAMLGTDPANFLYLATFYAEAAAITGFYLCSVGTAVALVRPSRMALALTACGALILAGSKFQHLLLPLLLALAVLLGGGRRRVALALAAGGLLGLALQWGNHLRATPIQEVIARINRANFVLSVLLPHASDADRVAQRLGVEPACAAYSGRSVYAMPAPFTEVCTQVDAWSSREAWRLLLGDPRALVRAGARVPGMLLPWIPGLGVVAGEHYQALPASVPTIDRLLPAHPATATALLLLPWLVLLGGFAARAPPAARAFASFCAVGSASVVVVALFGDGEVEFARHSQLAINFALASLALPLAAAASRLPGLAPRQ